IAFKGFIKMLTLFSHDTPRPLYVVFYCTRWLLQRVYFLVYIQIGLDELVLSEIGSCVSVRLGNTREMGG
ncbi:hypothetical protein, partial [Paenibacillus macerans]|uniref:hypothetical protein n=1 Tax=Paenibacillus macerans TaxID=44252 RepID=UPI00204079C6